MKKIVFTLIVGFAMLSFNSFAQIETPAASSFSKVMQVVGLTDVTIEYSRPNVKERTIFAADGLVPYGQLWRTGANSATKITFSTDVKIEGQDLSKGSYAILTIPTATTWDINFYSHEGSRWSTYKEATPALTVKVNALKMPEGINVETFVISFGEVNGDKATIQIMWDDAYVPIKMWVPADEAVMASIEKVLSGPSNGDYYAAANYYHTTGKDLNKAYEYIVKATSGADKKFWQLRRQSLIEADLGKYKQAIKTATLSKELAMKAENMDFVKMNEENIAKWAMKK